VSRSPFLVAATAVVLLALMAIAAVSLRDSEHRDPMLESALAAVGDGPVLHAIVRERISGGRRYDVETGRTRSVDSVYESWIDAERGHVHAVQRSGGEIVSDELVTLDGFEPAQTTATLAADYRRRLEEGELRIARTGAIRGRKVHWLASTAERPGVPPFEAAVDAESYRLVRVQTIGRYFQTTRDFELLESVARNEADFVVRFGTPTALSQVRPEGRLVDTSEAARAVPGAQWAGERVDDLRLRAIRAGDWRAELRPGGEARAVILTVAYGEKLGTAINPAVGTPTGIEIVQAADDSEARRFLRPTPLTVAPPPAGTFDLSGESNPSGQFFIATLRRPGVWILVRAPSRRLLFETVRALRPIS
jgi:hypothetical protein